MQKENILFGELLHVFSLLVSKLKLFLMQIGVHHAGKFYEFVPWTGFVTWDIAPWGYWKMTGENETHLVQQIQMGLFHFHISVLFILLREVT